MTDFLSKKARSVRMATIKGKNTGLESRCFLLLKEAKIRFRKYPKGVFGNPDAANKSKKLAIFVDSKFWHGHDWKNRKHDFKFNRKFWLKKIEGNIARDKKVNRVLRSQGWKVVRIWEHEISTKHRTKTLKQLDIIRDAMCITVL